MTGQSDFHNEKQCFGQIYVRGHAIGHDVAAT